MPTDCPICELLRLERDNAERSYQREMSFGYALADERDTLADQVAALESRCDALAAQVSRLNDDLETERARWAREFQGRYDQQAARIAELAAALRATPCPQADFPNDTCDFWAEHYAQERCLRCAILAHPDTTRALVEVQAWRALEVAMAQFNLDPGGANHLAMTNALAALDKARG